MYTEVFLDMDGVLTDLVEGCCRLFNIPDPYDNPKNHGIYEITNIINIKPDVFWGAMDRKFWSGLKWTKHGPRILAEICKYVPEGQVTLLTSPIRTDGCVDGKMDWIRQHMPRWSRRFMMGPGKWAIAGPGKLLIDDFEDNINNWVTRKNGTPTGGHAILSPLRSNKLHYYDDPVAWISLRLKEYFNA